MSTTNGADEKPSSLKDRLAKYVVGLNRGPLATSSDGDKAKGEKPGAALSQGDQVSGSDVVEHVEAMDTEGQPLKKKERLKRHFKRYWFWYLLGNIIFLAIFLPLL